MNPNEMLEGGFALSTATKAWRLHSDSINPYDAFKYNFNVKDNLGAYKIRVRDRDKAAKQALTDSMLLKLHGIQDFKKFVSVCYVDTSKFLVVTMPLIALFERWEADQQLPVRDITDQDFEIVNGVPRIMGDCDFLETHRRIRALTHHDAWTRLQERKADSDFMFDVKWWDLYRHAGIYQ